MCLHVVRNLKMNENETGDKALAGYYETANYTDGPHNYEDEYYRGLEYGPSPVKQQTKRNPLPELDVGDAALSNKATEKIDNLEKQNAVSARRVLVTKRPGIYCFVFDYFFFPQNGAAEHDFVPTKRRRKQKEANVDTMKLSKEEMQVCTISY